MSDQVLLEMKAEEVSRAAAYPLDLVHFAAPAIYKVIQASAPGADPRKLGQIFDWAMWDHWKNRFERLGVRDPNRLLGAIKSFFDDECESPPMKPQLPAPRVPRKLSKASKAPSVVTVPEPETEFDPVSPVSPGLQRFAFKGDVRQVVRKFTVYHFTRPMPFTPGENGEKGKYMFSQFTRI